MRIPCTIEETDVENEHGRLTEGICAKCSRCGHETESAGTGDRSARRCLVLLREECPKGEANFYFNEDEE